MGKKKRGHPDLEELINRPWCYYCERDFDDLKILISHQKAKHFKCERCGRRLNTAGGLSVHMSQVHKETLSAVDNALPNRSSLDVEIFGMEGVPEEALQSHHQRVMTQYQQAEADRRAATGNPAPGAAGGASGGQQSKKPKMENASDLKKRLAEHKAKKASGVSSGDATPVGAGQPVPAQASYNAPQATYPATANQPLNGANQQPQYPQPYGQAPYHQAFPNQPATSGYQQFPNAQYSSPAMSPSHYQTSPPMAQPPMAGQSSPPMMHQQPQPAQAHSSAQTTSGFLPPRPGSLPTAPGLPQRPSLTPPQVNSYQMQQMHHAQLPVQPPIATQATSEGGMPQAEGVPSYSQTGGTGTATTVDDLISGTARQVDELAAAKSASTSAIAEERTGSTEDKPAKKERAKGNSRLVYSDNDVSPEEKMARLPRYAFVPDRKEETALADATTAGVARVVDASDEIVNPPQ